MKNIIFACASLALVGVSGATTITLAGGPAGPQFLDNSGNPLATGSIVQVGSIFNGIFTQFDATDVTSQIGLGTVPTFAGRITGNASDNTAAADAFNGLEVFVRVVNSVDNVEAFFNQSTPVNFPVNGGGVGDSANFVLNDIDSFDSDLTDAIVVFDDANNTITLGVPEPSTALLGLLGLTGILLRRR